MFSYRNQGSTIKTKDLNTSKTAKENFLKMQEIQGEIESTKKN